MADSRFVNVEWAQNKKHRISFEEAATVFGDPLELVIPDPELEEFESSVRARRQRVSAAHTKKNNDAKRIRFHRRNKR